jgi:hypothetical protein
MSSNVEGDEMTLESSLVWSNQTEMAGRFHLNLTNFGSRTAMTVLIHFHMAGCQKVAEWCESCGPGQTSRQECIAKDESSFR